MVQLHCFTNLDISYHEKWPTILPFRPMVGDFIQSNHDWPSRHKMYPRNLTLKVVRITIVPYLTAEQLHSAAEEHRLHVELHLPENWYGGCISTFMKWYEETTSGNF